jgi:hypothetical protein
MPDTIKAVRNEEGKIMSYAVDCSTDEAEQTDMAVTTKDNT